MRTFYVIRSHVLLLNSTLVSLVDTIVQPHAQSIVLDVQAEPLCNGRIGMDLMGIEKCAYE